METIIKEVNGQYFCQKENHNHPILFAILNDDIPFEEKFLCEKCCELNKDGQEMTPINTVIDEIKKKKAIQNKDDEQRRWKSIKALKEFQQIMNDIYTKTINNFEQLKLITEQQIADLELQKQQDDFLTLLKEYKKNQSSQSDVVKKNNGFIEKTTPIFQEILDVNNQKKCYDDLINIITQDIANEVKDAKSSDEKQQPKQINQPQLKVSQVTLLEAFVQQGDTSAMAFNNDGTIMVSANEEDLIVWKFDNEELTKFEELTGHTDRVTCITFSKKHNWFASAAHDSAIRLWKEQNNVWISSEPKIQHTHIITSLIFYSNENELISSCLDKSIIVWKVNYEENLLEYYYTLEQKHTADINCLSINESETALVSCGEDKQIILWANENNKWIYQHHITNEDYGNRLCFISDDQIVWVRGQQGITHIFQIQNGELKHKPELSLLLNKENEDSFLFPTIFNKQKQIIIQKHNKYVYILQQQADGKLFLAHEPIDCNFVLNYGTLSNDGQFLVTWNCQNRLFRVYQIEYE